MTLLAEKIEALSIRKLHPVIGAEVLGVDLSSPLDEPTVGRIKDAWHQHTVLVFRNQKLSEDDQRRFASYFGPIAKRVPPKPGARGLDSSPDWTDMMLVSDNVDAKGNPTGSLGHGEMWFHSDKCYHRRPHRVSFLYGLQIPSEGGHTLFASLYAAYERLPADLKARLDGVMVMQGHQYSVGKRIDLSLKLETIHHYRQPIIITNPGSGRKAVYVATQNTMWIEGMDRAESEALLERLFAIVEDPAIIYEHVWRVGDLVMWDNLACLHARTNWPAEEHRTLRRCTVEGEPLY